MPRKPEQYRFPTVAELTAYARAVQDLKSAARMSADRIAVVGESVTDPTLKVAALTAERELRSALAPFETPGD